MKMKAKQYTICDYNWSSARGHLWGYDQPSILKSRNITLPTKVHLVKAIVFLVVMYGCESWTTKKADGKELMLLNCGMEDSWESLGLQGDQTNQS